MSGRELAYCTFLGVALVAFMEAFGMRWAIAGQGALLAVMGVVAYAVGRLDRPPGRVSQVLRSLPPMAFDAARRCVRVWVARTTETA